MANCFIERHVNVPGTMWCECGSLVAGTPIDGYNVISYLGHGTSGDVYLAEQPALNNRKVVIKIAHRSWNQSDIDNFRREAALLASLSHPYILPIYAYGVIYERQSQVYTYSPYLVLPYAEKGTLEDAFTRAGKRPWPLMRVVSVAQEIAEALDYAHSRGVLHRDVKPANLLQMESHVLLSDFSVASLIDAEVSHMNSPWAGSPAYMAPEVWRNSPGRYSDQYALAVTCFRLLTGDYPWANMNEGKVQEWLHLHCHVPPRSVQTYRPNLPDAVDLVLQMGMAKDPHKRYETVQAFAADLLDASEDKTLALNKPVQEAARELIRAPMPTRDPSLTYPPERVPHSILASVREEGSPVPAVEPVTEGVQENVGADSSRPAPIRPDPLSGGQVMQRSIDRRSAEASQLANDPGAPTAAQSGKSQGVRSAHRWLWSVLILNGLICILLAAEAYWQSKNIMFAVNLLLALWPSLLIGPLLTRWFRGIRLTTLSWGVFWGVFFGMTNVLFSGLVCYIWTALATTIPHWGHDWQYAGDGLHIFVSQIVLLAQPALTPLLISLWLAVLGGALIGISIYRSERR